MFVPVVPAVEEIVMIRPQFRAHMPPTTARQQCMTPHRLTRMAAFQVSGSDSRNCVGTIASAPALPALLTRMSIGPSASSTFATPAHTEP